MSGRWRDRRVGCEKALVPEEGGGATMVKDQRRAFPSRARLGAKVRNTVRNGIRLRDVVDCPGDPVRFLDHDRNSAVAGLAAASASMSSER